MGFGGGYTTLPGTSLVLYYSFISRGFSSISLPSFHAMQHSFSLSLALILVHLSKTKGMTKAGKRHPVWHKEDRVTRPYNLSDDCPKQTFWKDVRIAHHHLTD